MQKRVADIIADILVEHGITDIFSLVGGGAMFLNDAFGHHEGLRVMYNQHEQACSMAAGRLCPCHRTDGCCVRYHWPWRNQCYYRRSWCISGQLSHAGYLRAGALRDNG